MKYKLLFLVLFLCSCFSDKGNYEYSEIGDVTIEGITNQTLYEAISYYDTLRIKPVVTFKENVNPADFEYEWKLVPMSLNNKPEGVDFVIGKEKNLNYAVIESTGKYYGHFRVKNKKTNNVFFKTFFVSVRSLKSYGLAILCNDNDKARLDWVFRDTETSDIILKDLWEHTPEDVELMGKPISLGHYDYPGVGANFRMVNCEKGSFCLDTALFAGESANIKYRFGSSKDNIYVRGGNGILRPAKPRFVSVIDKYGDVYLKGELSSAIFAYRSNKVYGETEFFEAAPFVAPPQVAASLSQKGEATIFYDQTNCRFVDIRDNWNAIASFSVTQFDGNKFAPTTNREMVFMETTSGLNQYAVLRDKTDGKYYIYGFKIGASSVNTQRYYMELKGPNLDNVSSYLFHNLFDCLYYSSGDKVYCFDLTTGAAAKEVLSFPGEEVVKVTTYKRTIFGVAVPQYMLDYQNKLTIATNTTATNSGNIRIYDVPSISMSPVIYRDLSNNGFGKIVDICYFY